MNSTGILFGAPKTGVSYFIPNEVVLHIFGFLPEPDLVVASRVSKSFYLLANDYSLWKTHCSKDLHGKGKTVEVISDIQRMQVKSEIFIGFKLTSFKLYVWACRCYILENCTQPTPFHIHEEDSEYPHKANLLATKAGTSFTQKKIVCDNFMKGQEKLFAENAIADNNLLDRRLAVINQLLTPFSLSCERKGESIILTLSEKKDMCINLLNWALSNTYPENDIRFLIKNGATVTTYLIQTAISKKYPKNFIEFLLGIKVKTANDNYDLIQTAFPHPETKELIELLLDNGEEVSDPALANALHGRGHSDEIYELLITRKQHYSNPSDFLAATIIWRHSKKIIQLLIDKGAKTEKGDLDLAKKYKRPEKDIQLLMAHPTNELEVQLQWERKANDLFQIFHQALAVAVALY